MRALSRTRGIPLDARRQGPRHTQSGRPTGLDNVLAWRRELQDTVRQCFPRGPSRAAARPTGVRHTWQTTPLLMTTILMNEPGILASRLVTGRYVVFRELCMCCSRQAVLPRPCRLLLCSLACQQKCRYSAPCALSKTARSQMQTACCTGNKQGCTSSALRSTGCASVRLSLQTVHRHVCEPETKEAGGWDCGGRWLMDVFRLSKEHMLGFFHAEVSFRMLQGLCPAVLEAAGQFDVGNADASGQLHFQVVVCTPALLLCQARESPAV